MASNNDNSGSAAVGLVIAGICALAIVLFAFLAFMVRGFNVSNAQVNGSGDSLVEQSRPLLQVENIREATGGETALLDARDQGFFTVDVPNFCLRYALGARSYIQRMGDIASVLGGKCLRNESFQRFLGHQSVGNVEGSQFLSHGVSS